MEFASVLIDRCKHTLWVGGCRVDLGARTVHRGQESSQLTPKAASVLIVLADQPGLTVSRDELLERVWINRFTTPDVVSQAISVLRKALREDSNPAPIIETIPRLGYRLLAPVRYEDPPPARTPVDAANTAPTAISSAAAIVAGTEPPAAASPAPAGPEPMRSSRWHCTASSLIWALSALLLVVVLWGAVH